MMEEVSLRRRFAGQARLVRLLLWRVGDSTDVDACLQIALGQGMITLDDAAFLRDCMEVEECGREALSEEDAPCGIALDEQLIVRLRRCADKLNRADSA